MRSNARRVKRLTKNRPAPLKWVVKEPQDKDVYGAEAYTERSERRYFEREGDAYTQYVVPVVNRIGFRPNEER